MKKKRAAAVQPTIGFIKVEGGRLYYEAAGEGHPLVLLHAGIANSRMWDEQFITFSRHYRAIRYDARGFGKSSTEDGSFSNRKDLLDLLDTLGVRKAYLLGSSRGGSVALDFTLEFPDRVDALVLVAAGLGGFEPGPGQLTNRVAPEIRKRAGTMSLENFTRQDGRPQPVPLDPPALGRLGEVRVPTLVIVGDLDTTGARTMAGLLAEGIPGARKVTFNGAAHMVSLERPQEFNQLVLGFLGGLKRSQAE